MKVVVDELVEAVAPVEAVESVVPPAVVSALWSVVKLGMVVLSGIGVTQYLNSKSADGSESLLMIILCS